MYIGEPTERGIEYLVLELVANSIDQYLAGEVTRVRVKLQKDGSITVIDDGAGLPFDVQGDDGLSLAESWITSVHHTPTADYHSPHVHLNPHGIGLITVNALSSSMRVTSHRAGKLWEQRFSRGKALAPPMASPSRGRGTSITFTPDREIFEAFRARQEVLRRILFERAHIIPGIKLCLNQEAFYAPGGLGDYVKLVGEHQHACGEPYRFLRIAHEQDGIRVEAAACGSAGNCQWHSWCNGLSTDLHGAHVDGFKDVLRRMKWKPALAVIHVLMTRPLYAGPSRRKLHNPEVRGLVRRKILAKFGE